jgi:hypothetical protein
VVKSKQKYFFFICPVVGEAERKKKYLIGYCGPALTINASFWHIK